MKRDRSIGLLFLTPVVVLAAAWFGLNFRPGDDLLQDRDTVKLSYPTLNSRNGVPFDSMLGRLAVQMKKHPNARKFELRQSWHDLSSGIGGDDDVSYDRERQQLLHYTYMNTHQTEVYKNVTEATIRTAAKTPGRNSHHSLIRSGCTYEINAV